MIYNRKGGWRESSPYRSGLEDKIAEQLERSGIEIQYEAKKIKYVVPASTHTYTPDWVLPNHIIVESKGLFSVEDRKKHLLIKKQYPNLDIRFVFSSSKTKIRKGSKTSYADWCKKYGFKYADKLIPDAWLRE
mgnify:CR=1 FL=1